MRGASLPLHRIIALVGLGAGLATLATAQTVIEARGSISDAHYRFFDLSHSFRSGLVLDALYTGVTGMDELYLGLGYAWKPAQGITLTPIAYSVTGFQNGERGVTLGALLALDRSGFRSAGFLGQFIRVGGDVPSYAFADSLDLTRVVREWEVGASFGFFRQSGTGTWQLGPTAKRNDRRGLWAVAWRFGSDQELRLIRILTF
jgi:hypothetical protein